MKKIIYILSSFLVLGFTSCGGGEAVVEDANTDKVEETKLKGYEELDLTKWGFEMTLMVPNEEENGSAVVNLTERGALEVAVGKGFGVEIMFGEGDIELLKMDLKEDLVFISEILKEEENALVYTQDIPGSGVRTQNHFFYKAQLGTNVYEVRDMVDGEYGQGMIEEMLKASKTLKEKKTELAV